MRHRLILSLPLLALTGLALGLPLTASRTSRAEDPDPFQEPPLELLVEGLGDPLKVFENVPVRVQVGDEERTLRVRSSGRRMLHTDTLSFAYPSNYSYDYDPTDGSRTWTLDGVHVTLLLDVQPLRVPTRMMADQIRSVQAELFHANPEPLEPMTLELAGTEVKSSGFSVEFGGLYLRSHLFPLDEVDGTTTHFLSLQALVEEGESADEEFQTVLDLLQETFVRRD